MEYKDITVGEFLDAMEKNGFRKGVGEFYFLDDKDKVGSACAYGQAAINLGVSEQALYDLADEFGLQQIAETNDHSEKSVPEIAVEYREKIKAHTLEYYRSDEFSDDVFYVNLDDVMHAVAVKDWTPFL